MADSKHQISRSLESAKNWIDQAEESFDKNSDVRGELNLFLAKAELQRVQEVNRLGQWRWKYPLIRHGFALGVAAAFFLGAFYWWDARPNEHQPMPSSTSQQLVGNKSAVEFLQPLYPTTPPVTVQPLSAPAPFAETGKAENNKPLPVQEISHPEPARPTPEREVQLTPSEMQQLIRAAGKSLRGQ